MQTFKRISLIIFAVFIFVSGYFLMQHNESEAVEIGDGANAVDMIGQLDTDTGLPIYSHYKNGVNNGPSKIGFNTVYGAAVDTVDHRLFVSDMTNNRILVYNLNVVTNLLDDHVPDFVLGQPDFYTSVATGEYACTAAKLSSPGALAYDSARKYLFVADEMHSRVLIFDVVAISNGESAIKVLGQPTMTSCPFTFATDATQANFYGGGISYDYINSRLFVADYTSNRVLVFDVATITDGENAVNVLGQVAYNTRTSGTTDSTFYHVNDVAYDGNDDYLYTLETGNPGNNRVLRFDVDPLTITNGQAADRVFGQADFVSGDPGDLVYPSRIAYSLVYDRLYVGDAENKVKIYNTISLKSNGDPYDNYLGNGSSTQSQNAISNPLAVDTTGAYLFSSGTNSLKIFDVAVLVDEENAIDSVGQYDDAGAVSYTKSGANNGPNKWGLNNPASVAIDTVDHRLFVGDSRNARVLVYNLDSSNQLLDLLPDLVLGKEDFSQSSCGGWTDTCFLPSDTNDVIRLEYDHLHKRLFVSTQWYHSVFVIDADPLTLDSYEAVSYIIGQSSFFMPSRGTTQSKLDTPSGLFYDPTNENLYVADSGNNRVLVFNVTPATMANGIAAENVIGQADFISSSSGRTQSQLWFPVDVNMLGTNLFVADYNSNRVLVYDLSGGITDGMPADNVLGQADFVSGEILSNSTSSLGYPQGLTVDTNSNRLFVSQWFKSRITVFDVSTIVDNEAAINVLGQPNFTSSDLTVGDPQAGIGFPVGIDYNESNDLLYVAADSYRNGVMVFNAGPLTPVSPSACLTSNATTSTIDIAWTDNSGNEDNFVVEQSPDNATWTEFSTLAADAVGETVNLLDENTQYYFRVKATNAAGDSDYASCAAVYTLSGSLGTPVATNATTKVDYIIDLSDWNGVMPHPPTGMKIEKDTGCDGYETTVYDNAAALAASPYSVTGLNGNTCYKFKISTYNGDGVLNTGSAEETTALTLPPGQPIGLSATFVATTGITWDWTDVDGATGYKIYDQDDVLIDTIVTASSTYLHEDLTANTSYTVYVRATNANGEGIASSESSTYTSANIPISLTIIDRTIDSLSWDWQSGGGQKDYHASSLDYEDNLLDERDWAVASDWLQSVNLEPNRLATLYVRARNEDLEETPSPGPSVTYYTLQADPTGISLSSAGVDSLTIAAEGDFRWLEDGSSGFYFENLTDETNSGWIQTENWVNSSLLANTQYTYQVTARNGDGVVTATSDEVSFYTAQNTPTGLSGDGVDSTSMQVTATGNFPRLNVGTSGLYFENVTNATNSGWVTTNGWLEDGLTLNATYEYRVKARNGDGTETAFTAAVPIQLTLQGSGPVAPNTPDTIYICNDNIDNDSDGLTDYPADPGCTSSTDNDEYNEPIVIAPNAPLVGTPEALSSTTLRWYFTDQSSNETSFELRDENDVLIKNINSTDLTYIDETGLTPNTLYQRKVYAVNSAGSNAGALMSKYTLAAVPVVTKNSVVGVDAVKLTVNYNSNPDATAYAVYDGNSGTWLQINGMLGATKLFQAKTVWDDSSGILIQGLQSGTQYNLKLVALNSDGTESEYSADNLITFEKPATANLVLSKLVSINVGKDKMVLGTVFGQPVFAGGLASQALDVLPYYSSASNGFMIGAGIFVMLFLMGLVMNSVENRTIHKLKHLKHAHKILIKDLFGKRSEQYYELMHPNQPKEGEQYEKHNKLYKYTIMSMRFLVFGVLLKVLTVVVIFILLLININGDVFANENNQPVTNGDELTYRVEITNNGLAAAHNIVFEDNISDQMLYLGRTLNLSGRTQSVEADGDNCQLIANKITCHVPELGAEKQLYVEFKIMVAGIVDSTLTNSATASYTESPDLVISNLTTNQIQAVVLPICNDKLDNDVDGLIDYPEDIGCSSVEDTTEDSETEIGPGQTLDVPLSSGGWTYIKMAVTAKARFQNQSASHSVYLHSINGGNTTFTLASDPFDITLATDGSNAYDTNGNGQNDLSVKLVKNISGDKAIVGLKLEDELPPIVCVNGATQSCVAVSGCNGTQTCANNVWGACVSSLVKCQDNSCVANIDQCPVVVVEPTCGDAMCNGLESCETCQADCGPCPMLPTCGDNICNGAETCDSCSSDCKSCEPVVAIVVEQVVDEINTKYNDEIKVLDEKLAKATDFTEIVSLQTEKITASVIKNAELFNAVVLDNPAVEQISNQVAAPTVISFTVVGVANVAGAAASGAGTAAVGMSIFQYLQFFIMQPLMLLSKKQRAKWGIIYDSLTKKPVSLAIIRLFDKKTGTLKQTKVSDKNGRYQFIVPAGEYYVEVYKDDYKYPSQILYGKNEDETYLGLYHGGTISVDDNIMLNYNIPIDPEKRVENIERMLRRKALKRVQYVFSMVGPVAAFISLIIKPTWWVAALLLAQIAFIYGFKKMALPPKLKNWGTVSDALTKKPLVNAVVRIFDTQYNKLLESQITDGSGRYGFLVGKNNYYVTVEKSEFEKFTTPPITVVEENGGLINRDVQMTRST